MDRERKKIICLGEFVVDLIGLEAGRPLREVERFERHPGGAPANVAAGLHRHGLEAVLWSKVGADAFGHFLLDHLRAAGLPAEGVVQDARYPTRVVLIGRDERGERVLEILNRQSADQHLRADEVPLETLEGACALHVGGTTLLGEVTAETARQAVEAARRHGCLVSLDPNIRPGRGPGADAVRARLAALLPSVDVLQTGAADWVALWGERSPRDVLAAGCSLVVVTDGARGARLFTDRHGVHVPAPGVAVVDPTGAGDAFLAALLARITAAGRLADATEADLRAWGGFAAGWAGRILQHHGATTGYRA